MNFKSELEKSLGTASLRVMSVPLGKPPSSRQFAQPLEQVGQGEERDVALFTQISVAPQCVNSPTVSELLLPLLKSVQNFLKSYLLFSGQELEKLSERHPQVTVSGRIPNLFLIPTAEMTIHHAPRNVSLASPHRYVGR